jgi:hypothetical protein
MTVTAELKGIEAGWSCFAPGGVLSLIRFRRRGIGDKSMTTMQSDIIETIASIRSTAANLLHRVGAGEISEPEAWAKMLRRIVLAQKGVKLEKVS